MATGPGVCVIRDILWPVLSRLISITGGTGFVGRHLVRRHLEAGDRVRILTRRDDVPRGAERIAGDLASGRIPAEFVDGADILYHCAGEIRDAARMEAVHVNGTRALIAAANGEVGRWVQLSSVGVYGKRLDGPVLESDPPAPVGVYERTKADADVIVQASGIEHTIVRPSIIFGNDMPNQSLRQLVSMIERGLFFFIGPPGASANYVHVENVIDALQLAAGHDAAKGEVFNISDHLPMEQFVETIAESLGRKAPRMRVPVAPLRLLAHIPRQPLTSSRIDALTSRAVYPTTKIETKLGYQHRVPLAEGLRAFVKSR